MGPEFWQTMMGRKLVEATLPSIARSLERISAVLEKSNGNFNTIVQQEAARLMGDDWFVRKTELGMRLDESHVSRVRNKLQTITLFLETVRRPEDQDSADDAREAVKLMLVHLKELEKLEVRLGG